MSEKLNCSICGQEATVHLTQIINNKMHKVDLCESCAQNKGVTDPEGFALADLLGKSNFVSKTEGDSDLSCPKCNYTTAEFRRTGRLGCAQCYVTFVEQVRPVLVDMHVGVRHVGKVPELAMKRLKSQQTLADLKSNLSAAIAEEAYERAAELRDEIATLESAAATAQLEISLK